MKRNNSNQNQAAVSNPLANIQKIEKEREERRRKFEEIKQQKQERDAANKAAGRVCDVEFDLMIDEERKKAPRALNHVSSSQMQICVCVRKWPLFEKEVASGEIDSVSCPNPKVMVHEPKIKVDGITKFINNSEFNFDNTYSEKESSNDLYKFQIKDLLPSLFKNGVLTLVAYGQTGSGKTFTVTAATHDAVHDLFKLALSGT